MARLEIAAGLRLWLGRSGPVEDALYAYPITHPKSQYLLTISVANMTKHLNAVRQLTKPQHSTAVSKAEISDLVSCPNHTGLLTISPYPLCWDRQQKSFNTISSTLYYFNQGCAMCGIVILFPFCTVRNSACGGTGIFRRQWRVRDDDNFSYIQNLR